MGKLTQDYVKKSVRAAAILTNGYVAGTKIGIGETTDLNIEGMNQLVLLCDFTIGSLTDAQIKVEFSHDGTTYYQETFQSVSAGVATETIGVHKLAATGLYRIPITIMDRHIRISSIGTGTVTSSSLAIDVLLGNN